MNDKQILVVEDDTELAATYKSLLEQQGCKVQLVSNGAAALRYLANKDVDAVLCDFSMPVLEGDLLYTSLEKTKPQLCERFIFVTGMAENPKFQPFINRNKERVLFKPVTVEQLAGALEKLPGWNK